MKSTIAVLLLVAFQQVALAKDASAVHGLGTLERTVVFAVQQEAKVSKLKNRKDLCIGFGQGLAVDEKAIISKLRRNGLRVHANEWCNKGPRGLRVGIVAPINETSPGTYELTVQVDDLSIHPGEHFATLLKRGTYVIRCEGGSVLQLMSYRQTCCSKLR